MQSMALKMQHFYMKHFYNAFYCFSYIMEWTEVHILVFAKEARVSEPWMYKPPTAKDGKCGRELLIASMKAQ